MTQMKALEAHISRMNAELVQKNNLIRFYEQNSRSSPNLEAKLREAMENLLKQDFVIQSLQSKNEEMSKELLTKNSTPQYYEQNLREIPELQAKILQASKYVTDHKSIIKSLQAGIAQRDTWLAEKDCLLQTYAKTLPSVAASEDFRRAMQNAKDVMTTVGAMKVNNRYVEFEDLSMESIR
jgi:hypothetical protein